MAPLYFVLLGLAVVVFFTLIIYVRFFLKAQTTVVESQDSDVINTERQNVAIAPETKKSWLQRLSGKAPALRFSDHDDVQALPTETLVDVTDVQFVDILDRRRSFLRTKSGDLVCVLQMVPVIKNSAVTAAAYNTSFAAAIGSLPQDMSLQFVSMPVPVHLGELTERYAMASFHWRKEHDAAIKNGEVLKAEAAQRRCAGAMEIGAMILDESRLANQRVALIVLTRRGSLWDANSPVDQHNLSDFQTQVEQVQAIFGNNNFPTHQLEVEHTLEILWHAYNPEISTAEHALRTQERFGQMAARGVSNIEVSSTLTQEQIQRALDDPSTGISRLLAPAALEESQASISFNNKTMLLYYIVDYLSTLPSVERLTGPNGQFANRLFTSYYVNIPSSAHIAQQSRKASTAIQAKSEINRRMGALESYKQREELVAVEHTRYGAETEKNVLRTLGLYVGVMVDNEDIRQDAASFEALMTSAGLRFVPANWNPLQVWQTMHPLGQRKHMFEVEDRNVFSADLAALNPLPTIPHFEAGGEFMGFTQTSPKSTLPVTVVRRRGKNVVPSEALVGKPGSGKSYALKQMILDWVVRGHRVIALDPNTELGDVAQVLGGVNIDVLGAKGFNLLHFDAMDLEPGDQLTVLMADLVFDHNVASIMALYQSLKGGATYINASENRLFKRALARTMERHDMHPREPRTWQPNKVFLKDVYDMLVLEMRNENPETIQLIQDTLADHCQADGRDYEKYNTPTNLDLSNPLVAMTFGLEQFKPDATTAAMAYQFAMRIAMQHAIRSFLLGESTHPVPFHIVIDEASQLLVNTSIVQTVVRMLSVLQKYDIFVHLAFQDIKAIANADSLLQKETGLMSSANTLIGTIPAYMLFKQEYDSARTACEVLNIPPYEAEYIQSQDVGECLLVIGRDVSRIPLQIKTPHNFAQMLETDSTSMLRRTRSTFAGKAPAVR